MAIFHLTAKVISRATGRSSVAAAAYRSAAKLRDHRTGLEHDYTRKGGVVHVEIITPADAPLWMRDRRQLWNAVEAVEKRRDAQLAREIEISLPRELDGEQRINLLRAFIQRQFIAHGMIADLAVHETKARDGKDQPHAHVMLTMRELIGEGFGKKVRSWNTPDLLLGWREAWARDVNTALERAGRSERIDHRSLDAQRADAEYEADRARAQSQEERALRHEKRIIELSREPEPKIGPTASAMEKRGIITDRGDLFRAANDRNEQRKGLGLQQLELRLELIQRTSAFIAAGRKRLDQLWSRAQVALSRLRNRVIGRVDRPQEGVKPIDANHRRKAILGHNKNMLHVRIDDNERGYVGTEKGRIRSDRDGTQWEAILGRVRHDAVDCEEINNHDRGW